MHSVAAVRPVSLSLLVPEHVRPGCIGRRVQRCRCGIAPGGL